MDCADIYPLTSPGLISLDLASYFDAENVISVSYKIPMFLYHIISSITYGPNLENIYESA